MAVFGKSGDERQEKIIADMIGRMNESIRRLRVLEQRLKTIENRINSIEQGMVNQGKNVQKELSNRDARFSSVENRIEKIEMTINEIIKQMKLVATNAKVEELKHLVDIFNPLKSNFVTKEEVEKIIEDKLSERNI
ncbi:MAG: hypothetical protein J7K72_02145 [Candidatus Aenigmarchaeota archaeon]|nr:hypothetical protein [Candidatus Aenigmarchaeota archaeon]